MQKSALLRIVPGLLVLLSTLARADIGDTLADLRQRYGSAQDLGGQALFEVRLRNGQIVPARGAADAASHYSVTVYFDGPRSAMEIFTRNTSDPAKAEMSPADVQNILGAIGKGLPWQSVRTPTGKQTWVWGDKPGAPPKLLARFDANTSGREDAASVLVIMEYTEK